MWTMRTGLAVFLILGLVSLGGAQTPSKAPPGAQTSPTPTPGAQPPPKVPPGAFGADIVTSLGKITLEQIKRNEPGGSEAPARSQPGSRLSRVKATTLYDVRSRGVCSYFNNRGILVSASSAATKPLRKEELLKSIKGLTFKKYPPKNVSAAFVKRSSCVVQGFYLSPDDKYVTLTTYDYICQ